MPLRSVILLCAMPLLLLSCGEQQTTTDNTDNVKTTTAATKTQEHTVLTYHAISPKDSAFAQLKATLDSNQMQIIYAINRVDKKHISKLDTIIVPDKMAELMQYSPYPTSLPFLKDVNKIIFFSYPAEAFGAYEHGNLVLWGPTNMGRKKDPTPTGLTYANWKKEVDTSSVKDEWILKWNVNVLNKDGVGFHEYDLPGYPASHSCLRLQDSDAHFLYKWTDQWILMGPDSIIAHGTPVMIFGAYPFGSRRPWRALLQNPKAMDITPETLEQLIQPVLQTIITEQQKLSNALTTKHTAKE